MWGICGQECRRSKEVRGKQVSVTLERANDPLLSPVHTLTVTKKAHPNLNVNTGQVRRQLDRLHRCKAASPRILRNCFRKLYALLQHLPNLSLSQERVSLLWKTFCLVPVQKCSRGSFVVIVSTVRITLMKIQMMTSCCWWVLVHPPTPGLMTTWQAGHR